MLKSEFTPVKQKHHVVLNSDVDTVVSRSLVTQSNILFIVYPRIVNQLIKFEEPSRSSSTKQYKIRFRNDFRHQSFCGGQCDTIIMLLLVLLVLGEIWFFICRSFQFVSKRN